MPTGQTFAILGRVDQSEYVKFPLNPDRIQRDYESAYVPVPVALADYSPTTPSSNPPPVAWVRNQPERVSLEVLIVAPSLLPEGRGGPDDIESTLRTLEGFRFKDKFGEPPDLYWTVGPRTDRVRLQRMHVDPKLWTSDLRIQQARVSIELVVIRPRSS